MRALVPILPLFFSFTLASFIVDQVTDAALTCEPVLLQWQGGKTPWKLSIVAADQSLIENLGTFTETAFPWTVDVPAGTVVAAQVTDSTGAVVTGKSFTVQPGTCTSNQSQGLASADSGGTSTVNVGIIPFLSPSSFQTTPEAPLVTSSSASQVSKPATTTASTTSVANISSPSPPVSGALTASSSPHKSRVGMTFAILIPCLIVLAILGLFVLRWRRRRREALSALEAQPPPPPHWFDRPSYSYHGASSNFDSAEFRTREVDGPPNVSPTPTTARPIPVGYTLFSDPDAPPPPPHWSDEAASHQGASSNFGGATEQAGALPQRPTLKVIPPAHPAAGSRTARTPGTEFLSASTLPSGIPNENSPSTSLDRSSKYVETLHSRIDALLAENAVLAQLATPHVDLPPPAYT
ncbi:hypothetical protein B0H12DRAFT_1134192 [Mycena haematopus]|nr:hypothetical protein B0H12DRAFT_1134192 [Mycena haematopus]